MVFDEAHHAPAPTYRRLVSALHTAHTGMLLLGLTATPTYHDETKRGWLTRLFPQGIITEHTAQALIAQKVLATPVIEEQPTAFTPSFCSPVVEPWCRTYRDDLSTLSSNWH